MRGRRNTSLPSQIARLRALLVVGRKLFRWSRNDSREAAELLTP